MPKRERKRITRMSMAEDAVVVYESRVAQAEADLKWLKGRLWEALATRRELQNKTTDYVHIVRRGQKKRSKHDSNTGGSRESVL